MLNAQLPIHMNKYIYGLMNLGTTYINDETDNYHDTTNNTTN